MPKKTMNLLFGADPEQFAFYYNAANEKCAFPPYKFRHNLGVPVTENGNHPIFITGDGYKIHEDGAAFEYAVRPSHNPRDLFDLIQTCMTEVSDKILKLFPEHCNSTIEPIPSIKFENKRWKEEMLQGLIDKTGFNMSTRFGCDSDQDAFNTQAKSTVIDVTEHDWRYSGGHEHISGIPSHLFLEDPILLVTCLALTSGLAAVAYSDVPELEFDRTFYYGKPGKYRVQNYGKDNPFGPDYQFGIEYRTPSSRWTSSWDIASKVFQWAEIGVKNLFMTSLGAELAPELTMPACQAILEADQPTALHILSYIESRV